MSERLTSQEIGTHQKSMANRIQPDTDKFKRKRFTQKILIYHNRIVWLQLFVCKKKLAEHAQHNSEIIDNRVLRKIINTVLFE